MERRTQRDAGRVLASGRQLPRDEGTCPPRSQRLVSGRSKQLRSQRRRAAPTQKPWTGQINAPSSAHIAVRRVGPGVRARRARKGRRGWIRVTDTRSRCRRAAGAAHQQGRPRADTVTELTAGGHTEHRPAGESDPATCVGHKTITPRERGPTRKSVRLLHAHTALQESKLARGGGGARARPAGVGAGLPAKAGDSV